MNDRVIMLLSSAAAAAMFKYLLLHYLGIYLPNHWDIHIYLYIISPCAINTEAGVDKSCHYLHPEMLGSTKISAPSATTTPLSYSSPSSPSSTASSSSSLTPNEPVDGSEIKSIRKELKQTKSQLERLQLQTKKYEKELDFYKALESQDAGEKPAGKSDEKMRELEEELKATLRSLAKAHAELAKSDGAKGEIDELNRQIKDLQNTNEHLWKDKEAKVAEVEELHVIMETMDEELRHCKQLYQQEEQLLLQQQLLHQQEKEQWQQQQTIPSASGNKCSDGLNAAESSEASVQSLEIENSAMKLELEKLREQLEKSHNDMHRILQGQQEAELQLEDAQHQIMSMGDELADLRNKKVSKNVDVGDEIKVPSSTPSNVTESDIVSVRKEIECLKAENERLKLSSGQKELITSLIFNLKSEIATLKAENESMKTTASSNSSQDKVNSMAVIISNSPDEQKHVIRTGDNETNDNCEDLQIVMANLEHQKEYLEVSVRDLQILLSEKETALAISMEHASMLRQVISQLERTHTHFDNDGEHTDEYPADFSAIRSNIKIAVYHANYLGAMCNKREERGEEKKDGDDIVHSLIDNIDALEADIQRLQGEWTSRELRMQHQDEMIQTLRDKIVQRSSSSASPKSVGMRNPSNTSTPISDQNTPSALQVSSICPPSPSVPPSPSIRLLMEMHQQLDEELQDCNEGLPVNLMEKLNLSDSKSEDLSPEDRFSPAELKKSMLAVDALMNNTGRGNMVELEDTIKNLKAANLEKDMQLAEKDAQIESFTEEITKVESERRQLEEKLREEKPFNTTLIEKVDKINADWIESEDQSYLLNELKDQIIELNSHIELKDKLLFEAGEKLVTLKELSKEKMAIELKRFHEKLKKQSESYESRIYDLNEEKLVLQIEGHNLRYFSDLAGNIDSANKQQGEKVDLSAAREELDRLQTQLAVLQQSKMSEGEKHTLLSKVQDSILSPSKTTNSSSQGSKSSPSVSSEKKVPRSKTPKRALTAEEAAIQIAARNNCRSATRLDDNDAEDVNENQAIHEGILVKSTPRDLRKKRSEQDCAVAMGCSPS